jgi:integrase
MGSAMSSCPATCHGVAGAANLTVPGGDQAGWRYVEFFTANINNDHTRRAYARACSRFFAWCDNRGLSLTAIQPFYVAAWVKDLQQTHGAPGVKQRLAAVRMLFDWLITGQVVPMNPAAAVRGPKHVVKTGKTPVLEGDEWRKLLASIPTRTMRGAWIVCTKLPGIAVDQFATFFKTSGNPRDARGGLSISLLRAGEANVERNARHP